MDERKPKDVGAAEDLASSPLAVSPQSLAKLNKGGRPVGSRNLHAKHPSSIAKRFAKAGLDWAADFADAIRHNRRERIRMWMRLLPYLITTTNKTRVRKWTGKASRAAKLALEAMEGR